MIFSVIAAEDLHPHHMNVMTAILNGNFKHFEVMEQPDGFVAREKELLVC